jgi:hypothetical protein
MVYLLLYVNDIVLTASNTTLLQQTISTLKQEFAMKDLGPLHHFLGVSVQHQADAHFLTQRQFALDILERAGMVDCKPASTSVHTQAKVNVVYLSTNSIQHQHTKHVEIDLHFVRERVAIGDVRVLYMPTTSQFVDIFTKGLPTSVFLEFRSSLNIHSG